MRRLVIVTLVVLVALLATGASVASAGPPTLKDLADQVAALQKQVNDQAKQIDSLQKQANGMHSLLSGSGAPDAKLGSSGDFYLDTAATQLYGPRTAKGWGAPTSLIGARGATGPAGPAGQEGPQGKQGPQGPAGPDPAQDPGYAGLFAMAPYVTVATDSVNGVKPPIIVFHDANVNVRSDGGAGLGNLIVGLNQPPASIGAPIPDDIRWGSNNLVCGDGNMFPGWGGFVAGRYNMARGACSTVCGGQDNWAFGPYCSIAGGISNTAGAQRDDQSTEPVGPVAPSACVSGGLLNSALGDCSDVAGGCYNSASGPRSSIGGGMHNNATGAQSGIGGGMYNYATGPQSSVAGGSWNYAEGEQSAVSGGTGNHAVALQSVVTGGAQNQAQGTACTVSGGLGLIWSPASGWAVGGMAGGVAYHN
jgi:hypothetical protein